MTIGLIQVRIQRGVGSGNITVNEIDTSKSIILCSSYAYGDGAITSQHATIVNSTTINCGTTMAWTLLEFGAGLYG